jgi:ATP-dependent Lhr-like helicase
MSAFERLSAAMKYQMVNTLGFTTLRPVQLLSIEPILDGKNCVVLAPTAGGKTEAAFFPLLSAMDEGDYRPVSVLYLSPIRALLNNQEHRLARYAETIGRRVFKWHGDTTAGERKLFSKDPADILLTTPESLEAMMMSPRVPAARFFQGLRAVVIDEVHAFAGDDRGAHLAAVLERLTRFSGRDVQRIGLSATVGNPEEILRWLGGRSAREGVVIAPPRSPTPPRLQLDYVASAGNAAVVASRLQPGTKRLMFVDSRRGVEELGARLAAEGVPTFVTHGSLSADERRTAERAFHEGTDCLIVATSALELGIDVGDLDHVLQLDSPATVASFLQRMGRTGRRPGTTPNCTFLCTKEDTTLQAAALLALHGEGFVEPVIPRRRAFHILAHQLLALCVAGGGLGRTEWFAWVEGATPFQGVTADERHELVEHMLGAGILADQDGKLWLGPLGERLYGRRNFLELYAVFSTPRLILVRHETQDIGTVDAQFLEALDAGPDTAAFTLAGRAWAVVSIDWSRGVCLVKPTGSGKSARWSGTPLFLSYAMTQSIRRVLVSDDVSPVWSKRAREVIQAQREQHRFLRDEPAPIVDDGESLTFWTHAGGKANSLLARMIEAELGGRCVVRNVSITCREEAGKSSGRLRAYVRFLAEQGRPNDDDAREHAAGAVRGRVSKFEPCLPPRLLNELLAGMVLDVEGARRVIGTAAGVSSGGGHDVDWRPMPRPAAIEALPPKQDRRGADGPAVSGLTKLLREPAVREAWSRALPRTAEYLAEVNSRFAWPMLVPPCEWTVRERQSGIVGTAYDLAVGCLWAGDGLEGALSRANASAGTLPEGLLTALDSLLASEVRNARKGPPGGRAGLYRVLGLLAYLDAAYRAVVELPAWVLGAEVSTPEELTLILQNRFPDEYVTELERLVRSSFEDLPGGRAVYNPVFGGAPGLEHVGADGDLLIDDLLVELKTTMTKGITAGHLWQLLGYAALDRRRGAGRVRRVGWYDPRFRVFWSAAADDVARELGARGVSEFARWWAEGAG